MTEQEIDAATKKALEEIDANIALLKQLHPEDDWSRLEDVTKQHYYVPTRVKRWLKGAKEADSRFKAKQRLWGSSFMD